MLQFKCILNMLNALQWTKVQQLNYINYTFFCDDLRGDWVSAAARQVNQSNMSEATKDPVNPGINHMHLTMRWPYSVIGAGDCPDPRWVPSFTKVPFQLPWVHKNEKAFQTTLVSLKSPFSPETQDLTCCDPHHSEKYSGSEPLNSAISPWYT